MLDADPAEAIPLPKVVRRDGRTPDPGVSAEEHDGLAHGVIARGKAESGAEWAGRRRVDLRPSLGGELVEHHAVGELRMAAHDPDGRVAGAVVDDRHRPAWGCRRRGNLGPFHALADG